MICTCKRIDSSTMIMKTITHIWTILRDRISLLPFENIHTLMLLRFQQISLILTDLLNVTQPRLKNFLSDCGSCKATLMKPGYFAHICNINQHHLIWLTRTYSKWWPASRLHAIHSMLWNKKSYIYLFIIFFSITLQQIL